MPEEGGSWDVSPGICNPITLLSPVKQGKEVLGHWERGLRVVGWWYLRCLTVNNGKLPIFF